jgi:signal transduction histidine kinase
VHDTLALAPREGHTATCDVTTLMMQACDMCERVVVQRDVILKRPSVPAGLTVIGQQAGLQRALVNLISNAIEVSPAKGVVQVHLDVVDSQVRILVADQGPGIAPQVMDRIFDPFFTTKSPAPVWD